MLERIAATAICFAIIVCVGWLIDFRFFFPLTLTTTLILAATLLFLFLPGLMSVAEAIVDTESGRHQCAYRIPAHPDTGSQRPWLAGDGCACMVGYLHRLHVFCRIARGGYPRNFDANAPAAYPRLLFKRSIYGT